MSRLQIVIIIKNILDFDTSEQERGGTMLWFVSTTNCKSETLIVQKR